MDFTLNGKSYTLTKADVEERLRGLKPPKIKHWGFKCERRYWPVKDGLGLATDNLPSDFYTNEANLILKLLGFVVSRF